MPRIIAQPFQNQGNVSDKIALLIDRGWQFTRSRSDKSIPDYSTQSLSYLTRWIMDGGHLAYRHDGATTIDIDTDYRQSFLARELRARFTELVHVQSSTPGHCHLIAPVALPDFTFCTPRVGFGSLRHKTFTQLYDVDALLATKVDEATFWDTEDLLSWFQPALPNFKSTSPGSALRFRKKGWRCTMLNEGFDLDFHANLYNVPLEVAWQEWETGVRSAHVRLLKGRSRAFDLDIGKQAETAREIYARLWAMEGSQDAYPSGKQLAACVGRDRRNADRALKRLEAGGFIVCTGFMPNIGKGRSVKRWSTNVAHNDSGQRIEQLPLELG